MNHIGYHEEYSLLESTEKEPQMNAGAPSKAQIRQLVQIQHEERLAATSELNPTLGLVTD